MKALKSIIVYLLVAIIFSLIFALKCVKNESMIAVINNKITTSFSPLPDASIDMVAFEKHYNLYPDRWKTVFEFLISNDLKALPLGRINLNENVYVSVSEYFTKDIEDSDYEAHKQYIDLQYIIAGEELIGLTREYASLKVITPYNKQKDIEFYEFKGGDLLLATPDNYFIFFPNDVHKPCIKRSDISQVKKIVIKIKYE